MKNWPSFFLVCEQPGQYHSCLVIQPKEIKAAWAVIRFRLLVLDTILVCTAQTTGVVSSCRYKRQSKVTEYVSLLVLAKSGLPNLLWALAKHPVCRICTLAKKKKKACCVFQSHSLLSLYTNHSWLMEVVISHFARQRLLSSRVLLWRASVRWHPKNFPVEGYKSLATVSAVS